MKDVKIGLAINIKSALNSLKKLTSEIAGVTTSGDSKIANLEARFKKATLAVEQQTKKVNELKEKLRGLESGEIAPKAAATLEKQLDSLNIKLAKTKAKLQELDRQELNIINSGKPVVGRPDLVYTSEQEAKLSKLNNQSEILMQQEKALKREILGVKEALDKAYGADTQAEIDKVKAEIDKTNASLEVSKTKATIAGEKLTSEPKKGLFNFEKLTNSVEKFGNRILGLAKRVFIFTLFTKAFRALRETIGNVLLGDDEFVNSLNQLQVALWTAFAPILELAIPALKALIRWITLSIFYIAAFIGALTGKSLKQLLANGKKFRNQAIKGAEASDKLGKSIKNTGKKAKSASKDMKELNKQLADFDELMILQDNTNLSPETGTGSLSPATNVGGGGLGNLDFQTPLNEEDMEKLNEFERWVTDHKDAIITGLEIAGMGALGLAIAGLIKKIVDLLGWFKKKDSGLDTQTRKTKTETSAVKEMSKAFAVVPSAANAVAKGLDGVTDAAHRGVPALDGVTDAAHREAPALDGVTDAAYRNAPALDGVTDAAYRNAPALDGVTDAAYRNAPALDGVTDAATSLSPTIDGVTTSLDNSSIAMKNSENQIVQSTPVIESNVESAFSSASDNVNEFTKSQDAVKDWSTNTSSNVEKSTNSIAGNIYNAFLSAGNNIKNFVDTTSTSIADWASNVANNAATAARRFASNWGSAISAAYNNLKNFAAATGEKMKGFWQENKATIITVGVLAGVTAGAIALAPYTGGLSLGAIPLLAEGAVLPPNKPFLSVVGDQKNGTNVETPLSTMVEAFNTALQQNGGYGNQPITIEIDGREFGRAVLKQGNREAKRTTGKLVFG